uniref:E3 ubiquitin protein ligase n=1 Tax=Oryza rufipogon TaxID=4529 RepID=A0A0E0PCC8_ORYRU
MGSTGEPDRKRRLSSSVAPGGGAPVSPAKRLAVAPTSEDKKLDFTVLKYKNQKLSEQLEAHKFEYRALENKFAGLKEKQRTHNETLSLVNSSWEQLVADLKSRSFCKSGSPNSSPGSGHNNVQKDGTCAPIERDTLRSLVESGATESSGCLPGCHLGSDAPPLHLSTANALGDIFFPSSDLLQANEECALAALTKLPENDRSKQLQSTSSNLLSSLNNVVQALSNLQLKHKQLAEDYQNQRDSSARKRAEHRRLKEELASAASELEETNYKLAALKAQRDNTQGARIPYPTLGNKNMPEDKELISKRLVEIKRLHEERIEILNKIATFQNILMDFKSIRSSKAFQLVNDRLQKSQAELDHYQTLLEKLQVDKDKFVWQERQFNLKVDLAEIPERVSTYCRNQVITKFKALVSSIPREMGAMQSEMTKHKEASLELNSLRAEVHSLSRILSRKERDNEEASCRSARAGSDITQLQSVISDLKQTNKELKLFADMYKRESTDSREIMESRDREFLEWAHVHALKSSLDESKLEQRVKAANEAEAITQQRLATAEAEIAESGQKLGTSRKYRIMLLNIVSLRTVEVGVTSLLGDLVSLSHMLKSKQEECEAYRVEVECIGQAYEDIQAQNQQLLQQIIERDDDNTKIFMEGVKAKQTQDALHLETYSLRRNLQQESSLMDLYNQKIVSLEDQLKMWSDRVGKLQEDGWQQSVSLSNYQRKLVDVHRDAQKLMQSLDGIQANVGSSRLEVADLLIELEKERFSKKRIEDDLEVMSRKASSLRAKARESAVLEKLRHEVKEYRGILKCGICHDRQKEVVITKCYHLFCNQCIQKSLGNRQRRCPSCSLSFGANDVKPIYI